MADAAPVFRRGAVAADLDAQVPVDGLSGEARRVALVQRAGLKAAAHAAVVSGSRSRLVKVDRITVAVSQVRVNAFGQLVCKISHPKIPKEANPFIFGNPPVMVPDGTTTTVTAPDGTHVQRANYIEDVPAAFDRMIVDVVRAVRLP